MENHFFKIGDFVKTEEGFQGVVCGENKIVIKGQDDLPTIQKVKENSLFSLLENEIDEYLLRYRKFVFVTPNLTNKKA